MIICPSCNETITDQPLSTQWIKSGLMRRTGKKIVQRWQCTHCGFMTVKPVEIETLINGVTMDTN
jgi:hypothetical protein